MKILFVVTDFGVFGGGERVAANLARALQRDYGHSVGILSFQNLTKPASFDQEDLLVKASLNLKLYRSNYIMRIAAKIQSLIRLKKFLKAQDWQVVLGIGTYPAIILGLIESSPTIRIGCEHASLASTPAVWRVLRKYAYPKLNHLVVLTQRSMLAAQGLNKNVSVIPNSLSVFPAGAAHLSSRRVLGVGRLDVNKSFDKLIEAFSYAVKDHPLWELRIIGEGDQKRLLQEKISFLGLGRAVTIQPPVADIENEYRNSSICALTSSSEGLPMVLLEAQGCGLPCIAFDCDTGPAEIIQHQVSGFLITPGDVAEFGKRLSELMGNAPLRAQFSRAAIKNAKTFSEKAICEKWQQLFSDMLNRSQQ
jgi:glycosyltransferase involved in cell wall biosynthesis